MCTKFAASCSVSVAALLGIPRPFFRLQEHADYVQEEISGCKAIACELAGREMVSKSRIRNSILVRGPAQAPVLTHSLRRPSVCSIDAAKVRSKDVGLFVSTALEGHVSWQIS